MHLVHLVHSGTSDRVRWQRSAENWKRKPTDSNSQIIKGTPMCVPKGGITQRGEVRLAPFKRHFYAADLHFLSIDAKNEIKEPRRTNREKTAIGMNQWRFFYPSVDRPDEHHHHHHQRIKTDRSTWNTHLNARMSSFYFVWQGGRKSASSMCSWMIKLGWCKSTVVCTGEWCDDGDNGGAGQYLHRRRSLERVTPADNGCRLYNWCPPSRSF